MTTDTPDSGQPNEEYRDASGAERVQNRAVVVFGEMLFFWSKIEREITVHIQHIEMWQGSGYYPRLDGSFQSRWPPDYSKFERRFKVRLKHWRKLLILITKPSSHASIEALYADILEVNKIRDDIVHNCTSVIVADDETFYVETVRWADIKAGYDWLYKDGPELPNAGLPEVSYYTEATLGNCVRQIHTTGRALRRIYKTMTLDAEIIQKSTDDDKS